MTNRQHSSRPRAKDFAWLAAIPPKTAAAWLLSERGIESLCRLLALAALRARPVRSAADVDLVRSVLGRHAPPGLDAAAVMTALKANFHLDRFLILRCHRPGGWEPRVELVGRRHVDAGLAAGKGVILYLMPSVWNHVASKAAFHRSGFRVSHLSRPDHGFCKTPFGARFLNPIQISVETRYLEERLVVDQDSGTNALRELSRRLKQNRLISIIASSQALRVHTLPFFDGAIHLAGGPCALALQTGAALLPVATRRLPDGSFTVTVEPAIAPPGLGSREELVTAMLARFVEYLQAFVLMAPEQFSAWGETSPPGADTRMAAGSTASASTATT